ncbi:DUF2058 domain-containing protein [Thalassotalea mangrovi]|uniref:DUF2058 domain-containing protein n=1 Tax=Thalassotalea mangrovi TaxID=2572245 RepID=A0A4U1BAR7_9GAMM|nr:DUF2058 domain-containing protein [Thalassotalea mangrovi]TKB47505.1 DUF2058 domain-containing protein [Thalassotalea mangrovi]
MASLQDQLLKAGLTTKQKARQANSDKRKRNKQKRSGAQVDASLQEQVKQDLQVAREEKAKKDQQLNADRQQAQAAKELKQRIAQILEHHSLKGIDGEVKFNFTQDNKVKSLFIDDKTHSALTRGVLALCVLDDKFYVVTEQTAEKVATLDASVVLVNHENQDPQADEDDPYADYQIPDDLMW